ncbi:MAG: hypothetical protein IKY98_04870 [Alphaproteobacteria bacterium]|nr:hypothetical protein [Alphaproteobacteria bacterium]
MRYNLFSKNLIKSQSGRSTPSQLSFDNHHLSSSQENIVRIIRTQSSSDNDTSSSLSPSGERSISSFLSFPCLTRESRNEESDSMNKDIMPTGCSGQCPSMTRIISQSGRSMVEMLGVLAIIGVLSIGGIAGYSYGMDKYRSNETMNDINLRSIDLIAQASRGADFTLAEWSTKTVTDYDIGLEVDTTTNTTEGGIYVDKVPQRVCEIMADSIPDNIELTVNGADYTGSCGETNKMVFYYDVLAEPLGENCDGPIVDGVCQPCDSPYVWNGSACACPPEYPYSYGSELCSTSENGPYREDNSICLNGGVYMRSADMPLGCHTIEWCEEQGGIYEAGEFVNCHGVCLGKCPTPK